MAGLEPPEPHPHWNLLLGWWCARCVMRNVMASDTGQFLEIIRVCLKDYLEYSEKKLDNIAKVCGTLPLSVPGAAAPALSLTCALTFASGGLRSLRRRSKRPRGRPRVPLVLRGHLRHESHRKDPVS